MGLGQCRIRPRFEYRVHAVEKWWVRRVALKIRRDTTRCGRCFKALFILPYRRRALLTFRNMMASWPIQGWLSWIRWQGSWSKTSALWQPSQYLPGQKNRSPAVILAKGFAFLTFWVSDSPGVTKEVDGIWTLITRLVILHNDWSSGSRDSTYALHWLLLHSLRQPVAVLWRRLTSAFRAGYLITFRSWLFRRISSWMPAGIRGLMSSRKRRFGVDAARPFRTATEKFSKRMSITIALCNSGSNGIWSSKWVWKLA